MTAGGRAVTSYSDFRFSISPPPSQRPGEIYDLRPTTYDRQQTAEEYYIEGQQRIGATARARLGSLGPLRDRRREREELAREE